VTAAADTPEYHQRGQQEQELLQVIVGFEPSFAQRHGPVARTENFSTMADSRTQKSPVKPKKMK